MVPIARLVIRMVCGCDHIDARRKPVLFKDSCSLDTGLAQAIVEAQGKHVRLGYGNR